MTPEVRAELIRLAEQGRVRTDAAAATYAALAAQSVASAEAYATALRGIQEAGGRAQARMAAVSAELIAISESTRVSLSRLTEGTR